MISWEPKSRPLSNRCTRWTEPGRRVGPGVAKKVDRKASNADASVVGARVVVTPSRTGTKDRQEEGHSGDRRGLLGGARAAR